MVLGAGLGTRLRPLTLEVPKPLAWLGDRPQIDHVIRSLARAGIERVVVNTHHLAEQFDDAWALRQPVEVVRLHEPVILGTGGGLSNARDALGPGDVVAWNGDILAEVDVAALTRAHRSARAAATLVVAPRGAPGTGTVGVDAEGAVARLRGEVFGHEIAGTDFIGVSMLGEALRDRLPSAGCLVGDALMPWLREGRRVGTLAHAGGFRDTGSLADYLDANLAWLEGRSAFVGEGAEIDPAVELARVVVGPRARIRGAGVLSDCVIWPDAEMTAPLERAIATPRGTVLVR
jgi:mannose-1-phosphate guanylyltransferase